MAFTCQSGPGNNRSDGVLLTPHISRIGSSSVDVITRTPLDDITYLQGIQSAYFQRRRQRGMEKDAVSENILMYKPKQLKKSLNINGGSQ